MYLVTDEIAVHGLGEKGTHPLPWNERDRGYIDSHGNMYDEHTMKDVKNFYAIYDVRFLSDLGEDNPDALYGATIENIEYALHDYFWHKVVICCGAGQSRSCGIAVGVLMKYSLMNYYDAVELVRAKVPICNIDPSHLAALRRLFNVGPP